MKKSAFAIVTLALLSACGERGSSAETGDKPSVVADQALAGGDARKRELQTQGQRAQHAPANTALTEAGAQRAAAYKRQLLPLIAANYTGDCTTGAGATSRSSISVSADGTVGAPGMKASQIMDADVMLVLTKVPSTAATQTVALGASSDVHAWTVHSSNSTAEVVTYRRNNESIRCINDAPVVQSRPGNVYPALAQFFVAAARSMNCSTTTVPNFLQITPGATGVTVDGDTLSLVRANAGEIVG